MNPRDQSETGRPHAPTSLYAANGDRKYLNREERGRALHAMEALERGKALFVLTLAWTGARISEVLALTPSSFQIDRSVVAIRTLKRRCDVVREVPIPPALMRALDQHFQLREAQRDPERAHHRLWPSHRVTAWRSVKSVMMLAQLRGPAACPRGLRHSFAVGALQCKVPLTLLQRWLGHARMTTTAIYVAVCGPEEIAFAERFWRANDNADPHDNDTRSDVL